MSFNVTHPLQNRLFTGVVSASDPASYVVQIDAYGGNQKARMQGIPLAGVFASTLGFKKSSPPPAGAVVLCYQVDSESCYILGIIPDYDRKAMKFYNRSALGCTDARSDTRTTAGYHDHSTRKETNNVNRPTDVVGGEEVISNEFGVLMGLFQQVALLKGSELAQIQCYLLDDLVRIVSHNYQHFTALGEFSVFHDGQSISAEFGATHLPQESMGIGTQTAETEEKSFEEDPGEPLADDSKDYYKMPKGERQKAIERLKVFLGRLGDFVNIFLVTPRQDAVKVLAGNVPAGSDQDVGLFNCHVSLDGRLTVRTASSMSFEKTNWIAVPERIRTPEDPEGDDGEQLSFDTLDPFAFDDNNKFRDNPMGYALQLRDCNAYLQDFAALRHFLKHEKDFSVVTTPESRLNQVEQVDPITKTNIANYELRKAGIYIMDNGGIVIRNAWGAAIVMDGPDISFQPARDLLLQPARNLIGKVGQFTSIAGKKDIDFSSTEGGLRAKTKLAQHYYSHKEGIIIQSDGESAIEPTPEDKAYENFGGILLKAKKGIHRYAEDILDRASQRALYKSEHLILESVEESMKIVGRKGLTILSEKDMDIFGTGKANFIVGGMMNVAGTTLNLGNEGSRIGMIPADAFGTIHEGVIPIEDILPPVQQHLMPIKWQSFMHPFTTDDKFTKVKFRFLASDKYNLKEKEDFIPMTLAQQDDAAFSMLGYIGWSEVKVEETLPYPGEGRFENFYLTGELKNYEVMGSDLVSKDSLTLANDASLTLESLNSYKVFA